MEVFSRKADHLISSHLIRPRHARYPYTLFLHTHRSNSTLDNMPSNPNEDEYKPRFKYVDPNGPRSSYAAVEGKYCAILVEALPMPMEEVKSRISPAGDGDWDYTGFAMELSIVWDNRSGGATIICPIDFIKGPTLGSDVQRVSPTDISLRQFRFELEAPMAGGYKVTARRVAYWLRKPGNTVTTYSVCDSDTTLDVSEPADAGQT